ncbi:MULTISPECIES: hypothetical protein [Acinetobacter]|uniref:Uncharacterized protein n=1 Tax=Acinetobacter lanii TaxID=2715163 RepID=A0A6G8S3Z1_9GAMM|nr:MULTISPECIES: hypothetical protein [Acinetobacter]NHB58289.1 hypothetical protein [Acinetobacter shaoyimingii]QIO08872.1 hypothetical protein G8D99_07475 [Acinetobacter lanii]
MNEITIDKKLLVNLNNINFDNEDSFKISLMKVINNDFRKREYNGYVTYSFDCIFCQKKYIFSQTFFKGKKNGKPLLNWRDGNLTTQKMDMKNDFLEDVNLLKNSIENYGAIFIKAENNCRLIYKMNGLSMTIVPAIQDMSLAIELNV